MSLDDLKKQLEILLECQDAYVTELRERVEELERQVTGLEERINMLLNRESY